MKKYLPLITLALLLVLPVSVFAESNRQGQGGTQQRVQDPTTHDDTTVVTPQGNQQGQGGQQAGTENRGIVTAIQSLNRVVERNNNPEIGEQVRSMVQNHEKVQTRTEAALQTMSQKNKALKFLFGPDYKNAGQVRSDVVGLRNDVKKLEQIKEDSLPADAEDVQGAIDELQAEADSLEAQLEDQLSSFSLFGWLSKLLTN